MNDTRPMIEVRGAQKFFGPLEVLKGIDFSVARGQIVAVIGPSGSGKSTLLRSINHLETLDGGEVWLDGVQVNQKLDRRSFERHINNVRQQMGMVFQHFNLFPHLSVAENITIAPTKLKGMAIMLRSIGSTKAAEIVQTTCSARFFNPLEEWISGPDAPVRARLLAGFIMGMSVSRELGGGGFNMDLADCEKMRDRLAPILQGLIDG